ncbi:hypothetical protein ES703_79973 [subsurface metagenome]
MPFFSNFIITNMSITAIAGGFTIILTTDVPCHLWLRHTDIKRRFHPLGRGERGMRNLTDIRFCFVAYKDIEQDEIGDTTIHTFTWLDWVICTKRWFYFWGTSMGLTIPMTSAIFSLHYKGAIITTKFYPDAHPEVTCQDGHVLKYSPPGASWSYLHDAPDGNRINQGLSFLYTGVSSNTDLDKWFCIYRAFLLFDTSSIPAGAEILSATLATHGLTGKEFEAIPSLGLYTSSPASNTVLDYPDYSKVGTTLLAPSISFNDLPGITGDWAIFTLNPAGIANIIKGGISKFSMRLNWDADNSPPPWEYNRRDVWNCASAEITHKPYLEVKYKA